MANPCTDSVCQPSYGYHNSLPLTNATEEFEEKVNETKHSSNQDNPEGSLDAMMQAIVCKVLLTLLLFSKLKKKVFTLTSEV